MSTLRIVFDLDDTLYPERDFARSGFIAAGRHAAEKHGIPDLGEAMLALLDQGHRGIAHRFREIVYTDTLAPGRSMAKPHPRAFEVIGKALGRDGDRFVYIGDNPAKDFVAPNAMGWLSIWVDRPGGIHHGAKVAEGGAPQVTIKSLRELPNVLGI